MIGNLDTALLNLLRTALPGLLGGASPPVQLALTSEVFEVDPDSTDATAGEPRSDDRTDVIPFNSETPGGPYLLTQSPYPGARRVRLLRGEGDRLNLRDDEVIWDKLDSRQFTLNPRPTRNLDGVTDIQVLYGVTAIFTKLKLAQRLNLELKSANAAQLEQAESLAIAVLTLNRQQLIDAATQTYTAGDYGALVEIKSLLLTQGKRSSDTSRLLILQAETELKASRALRDDEGLPIQRLVTPGYPASDRPVDIHIQLDA